MTIVNEKILEPDTPEEFVEAAKIFDHDNDGKIEVAELRYAMSKLGDVLEESTVDEMIAELDKEKTGFVDIQFWAAQVFKLWIKQTVRNKRPKHHNMSFNTRGHRKLLGVTSLPLKTRCKN